MRRLLHIDSSIRDNDSVSRALSARARDRWRVAHPDGEVIYRDLGSAPVPHLTSASGLARLIPPEQHTADQAESFALTCELVDEVRTADAVVLGLPLYNYGAPSAVKAWVDHVVAPGVSADPETNEGLLGGTELIVLASRGGGYGPGAPKEGWDHALPWLTHALAPTGLKPHVIVAELTLAATNPAMHVLIPDAERSRAAAEQQIDELWPVDRPERSDHRVLEQEEELSK
ncbi:NAD(P)H-dependent oxidoreductase [Pseudonocardia kujensis]|uniref:FMN-dependent NADH-azoreductase n=1 Tax=Pseudonocardia kujensis TaxID=1128675 RepID=UPI001E2D1430|nr:NAD(P)H-dependent oxidoreductase [Pseudonocardia kujensis]MCE0763301.1 NAD(P)H-dependent oxidoreductase [Pseudonocardia kujensis]